MNPAAVAPARATPGPRARAAGLLVLALAIVAAFAGVARNGWVSIDDPAYVTDRPEVLAGLTRESVVWAFTQPHGGNWHPLTSLSHMADVAWFGLGPDGVPDPTGPHLVNLALHVLASLLLAVALDRLTRAWWPSLAVAALYALHPLRVESVAWIAERKDVLSALGFMLTLLAYARWVERPGRARQVTLVAAYAFGLLAKPMLVTVPLVLLLLDAWPLGRLRLGAAAWRDGTLLERVREKWPLGVAAAVVVAMTIAMQARTGAVTGLEGLPLEVRSSNAVVSYARYLAALVWPLDLAVIQPHPRAVQPGPLALASLVLAAIGAWVWRGRAERPWAVVGALWYVGMLVPVIGIVQVGRQGWADRYSQLPCIGVLVMVVWWVASLAGASRPRRTVVALVGIVVCSVLGVLTARQVARWRDSVTLFEWTVRVTGPNAFAELGLGGALAQAGRFAEAEPHLARAVTLEPDDVGARERWATVLLRLGRADSARAVVRAGLRRGGWPGGFERLGAIEVATGDLAAAVRAYREAERLGARDAAFVAAYADALRRHADALDDAGRTSEALAHWREALRLRPQDSGTLVRAGWVLACSSDDALRDGAEALRLARAALAAGGERPAAVVLALEGAALAESGRWDDAVRAARAAVEAALREGASDEAGIYRAQARRYSARRPFRWDH